MSPRIWFQSPDAAAALEAADAGADHVEVSLDLNLTRVRARIGGHGLEVDGEQPPGLELDALRAMARVRDRVFYLDPGGDWVCAEVRGRGYYKLYPTPEAPTIEIDGVRMHRTADVLPFEDSRLKAVAAVRRGDRVFDTCGGMGYTAAWARKLGAASVVSAERDANVLELRSGNPWTEPGLRDPAVQGLHADSLALTPEFDAAAFDAVIHDPPRFSLSGELYGAGFYAELFRILKRGGRLFHYTGKPYSRGRGRDFTGGVRRRLVEAGFAGVQWREELQGFTARR